MKENAILKINKMGKAGLIVTRIAMVLLAVVFLGVLVGTVMIFSLPEDMVETKVEGTASVRIRFPEGFSAPDNIETVGEHISGAQLLNDDSPIVRVVEGVPTVFGSPWSGKTPCYRNESYPIAAFVRLAQAPHNRIARLPVVRAIGALLPSCPPAFAYDAQLQDNICDTLSQLIARVPVYQLECLPDADAARLSFETTIADR